MAEISDFVRPNLYVVNGPFEGVSEASEIYFSLWKLSDLIPASQHVHSVVSEAIKPLKEVITEMDLGEYLSEYWKTITIVNTEKLSKLEYLQIPHMGLLETFDSVLKNADEVRVIGKLASRGILYATTENLKLVDMYNYPKIYLGELNETIDKIESKNPFVLDREKTKKLMEQAFREANAKIGDQIVFYHVECLSPSHLESLKDYCAVARISIHQLKANDEEKIQRVQASLVEGLKKFDGPEISSEVPKYMHMSKCVYDLLERTFSRLVQDFEILKGPDKVETEPNWRRYLLKG